MATKKIKAEELDYKVIEDKRFKSLFDEYIKEGRMNALWKLLILIISVCVMLIGNNIEHMIVMTIGVLVSMVMGIFVILQCYTNHKLVKLSRGIKKGNLMYAEVLCQEIIEHKSTKDENDNGIAYSYDARVKSLKGEMVNGKFPLPFRSKFVEEHEKSRSGNVAPLSQMYILKCKNLYYGVEDLQYTYWENNIEQFVNHI